MEGFTISPLWFVGLFSRALSAHWSSGANSSLQHLARETSQDCAAFAQQANTRCIIILRCNNMFSLFQDHDGSSLVSSSTNAVPLTNNETSLEVKNDRIELNLAPRSLSKPNKQQESWCAEVVKLKKDLQAPKRTLAPFQHFHSMRNVSKADTVPIGSLAVASKKSKSDPFKQFSTSSTDVEAVLVTDVKEAETADLPEVRQVRFLGTPSIDGHHETSASAKKKRTVSKRIYWTRNEVDCMKKAALQSAKDFRSERPGAVKRLKQLFEEFCWKQSNESDDSADTVDEEAEEMLHRFLIDWGLSTVRGLEERVVPRKVFDQDRRMAQESVLAYQQFLRESGLHSPPEMEAMLSARSESASRRARMFAM